MPIQKRTARGPRHYPNLSAAFHPPVPRNSSASSTSSPAATGNNATQLRTSWSPAPGAAGTDNSQQRAPSSAPTRNDAAQRASSAHAPSNGNGTLATPSGGRTGEDARQAALIDGFILRSVRVDGPNVVRRSGMVRYSHRPVTFLPGCVFPVTGSGIRYHKRGERPFVMGSELGPKSSRRYVTAKRSERKMIFKSLTPSSVPLIVISAYHEIIRSFPRLMLHPGIYGTGLFAAGDVECGRLLIEYTGNHVAGDRALKMHRALNRVDSEHDVFASIQDGKVTLDPRGCGNSAMCVNHSFNPNAFLYGKNSGTKTILLINDLRPILAGEEVPVDYGYNSLKTFSVLLCVCDSANCRLAV